MGAMPNPAPEPREPTFQTPFGTVLLVALLAKVLTVGVATWAAGAQPSDSPYLAAQEGNANDVVWYLARGFDANMYQRLAVEGYYDEFSKGFPLGYPLLIRAVHALVGNAQTAAVLVSNACGVGAVLLFTALAAVYARRRGQDMSRVLGASILFAVTPGVLAFGTVAYSESSFLLLAVAAWWAYLSADGEAQPQSHEDGAGAPRHLGWLALASLLGGASVMVRHLGATLFVAWAVFEVLRLVRSRTRGRALLEALCLGWAGLPVAGWFAWKFSEHDLSTVQQQVWDMQFAFLGAPASLLTGGELRPPVSLEFVVLIYMSLPLVLWLGWRATRLDKRLGLLTLLGLVLALSYTGTAAQAFNRYAWSLWPLALGALAVRERGVVWMASGWLLLLSIWCVLGHVQGSAAL